MFCLSGFRRASTLLRRSAILRSFSSVHYEYSFSSCVTLATISLLSEVDLEVLVVPRRQALMVVVLYFLNERCSCGPS